MRFIPIIICKETLDVAPSGAQRVEVASYISKQQSFEISFYLKQVHECTVFIVYGEYTFCVFGGDEVLP